MMKESCFEIINFMNLAILTQPSNEMMVVSILENFLSGMTNFYFYFDMSINKTMRN